MIKLRPITIDDIKAIKGWPPYIAEFEALDYALRENGWLDEYISKPETWIYVAEQEEQIIGFTLLSTTGSKEAEFRIAIHPQFIGKGIGKKITTETLKIGFIELNLIRIHLIVRTGNLQAQNLYVKQGFIKTGKSSHKIMGNKIDFINMELHRNDFVGKRG